MKNNVKKRFSFGLHNPKALWASLLLLVLFSGIMFKVIVHETPKDRAEYMKLMSQADPGVLGSSPLTPYSVAQNRSGIRKDYFYTQGTERLHICLLSDKATLMMHQGAEGSSLIEKMKGVDCLMQEELFYLLKDGREAIKLADGQMTLKNSKTAIPLPASDTLGAKPMQYLHHFVAQEASFHYQSGRFTGESVRIMHYSAPGHEIPVFTPSTTNSNKTMNGTAETIEFTFIHGKPHFKAIGFKAMVSSDSGRKL